MYQVCWPSGEEVLILMRQTRGIFNCSLGVVVVWHPDEEFSFSRLLRQMRCMGSRSKPRDDM